MSASVNLSNWREPEGAQWAFQNVDKILPVHKIARGTAATPLQPGKSSLDAFRLQRDDGSTQDWSTFLSSTETDGILILKHGKVVHEQYFRGNDAHTKHIVMSVSKSITGLIAGILAEQGKLDVSAPVTKYVPEVGTSSLKNATVQQCLDMRSNVKFDDSTPIYRAAAGWIPPLADGKAPDLRSFIANFEAPPPPAGPADLDGARFEYVSVNTDLIGWILERAAGTGETYADLVSRLLWQPMGAESDAMVTVDSKGCARAAGGICATVRDLARVGQLVLDGGRGIVPEGWIEDMLHNTSPAAYKAGEFAKAFAGVFPSLAYRSFWSTDGELGTLMALGIHGQHILVDRKNGIVMVKTSSQPEPADIVRWRATTQAFRELGKVLTS